MQSVNSHYVYLPLCRIEMANYRAHKLRQFALIFHDILSLFNYVTKLMIVLINSHFSTSAKFRKIIKILRKIANSTARHEIPWTAGNCGPY